jgi:5-oxoprolinase (ATP-hydrolysing) subunit A
MTTIDLNCDMGEREDLASGAQESLMQYITSASVACGAHAGGEALMQLTLRQALVHCRANRVTIGAHPGYPDRRNFGRLDLEMPIADLEASIEGQVRSLTSLAEEAGVKVRYVKPHGALYNRAAWDLELARAIGRAVSRVGRDLAIVGLAGSPALAVWREAGIRTLAEAFADRSYEADGSLRERHHADAVLRNPEDAARQALRIAMRHEVLACEGSVLTIEAETLCIHSDTPVAVEIARRVRQRLEDAGVKVCPWHSEAGLS